MKKKILRILAGVLMMIGAFFPVSAFADSCGDHKFFGLDPWYAGLNCESDHSISQSNFDMSGGSGVLIGTITTIVGTVVKDLLFRQSGPLGDNPIRFALSEFQPPFQRNGTRQNKDGPTRGTSDLQSDPSGAVVPFNR